MMISPRFVSPNSGEKIQKIKTFKQHLYQLNIKMRQSQINPSINKSLSIKWINLDKPILKY